MALIRTVGLIPSQVNDSRHVKAAVAFCCFQVGLRYLFGEVYGRKQRECAHVVRRFSGSQMSADNENARRWLSEEGGEGVAPGYGGRV